MGVEKGEKEIIARGGAQREKEFIVRGREGGRNYSEGVGARGTKRL